MKPRESKVNYDRSKMRRVSPPHFSQQSRSWRRILFICVMFSTFCSGVFAQYAITWHKISGGGGTSSNGQYMVSGTIGQPDANGPMTGGNYSITGGFWAFIAVVQTPGAPTLFITHAGNTITVHWSNGTGWHLQQNGDLSTTNGWTDSSGVMTSNGVDYLKISIPSTNQFYRLTKP